MPLIEELMRLFRSGQLAPAWVELGEIPRYSPPHWRAIAEDMRLRLGLMVAAGVLRSLPYATSMAVTAGHVPTKGSASYAINELQRQRVIRFIGEMPPLGKGNGTKLFVPPGWRPADPEEFAVAVELADKHRLADLVWVPNEPADAAMAVHPDVEGADQLVGVDAHGF